MKGCYKCKHYIPIENTFGCDCEESEGYGLETAPDDWCEEFEEKE